MKNKFYNEKDRYYKIINKIEDDKYIAEWFLNDNYIEQREIKIDILTDEYIKNNLKEITEAEYYITLCNYSDGMLVMKNIGMILNSTNIFEYKKEFENLINSINSNINSLYLDKDNELYSNYNISIENLKDKEYLIVYSNSKEILSSKIITLKYKLGEKEEKKDFNINLHNKRYFFNEGEYHVVVGENEENYICLDNDNKIYEAKKDGFEVELSIQQYLLETNIKSNLKDLVDYLKYCSKLYEIKFGINLLINIYREQDIKITFKRITRRKILLTFEDNILKDNGIESKIIYENFLDLQDGIMNINKYYSFYDEGFKISKLIKEEGEYYIFENNKRIKKKKTYDSSEVEYLLFNNNVKNIEEIEEMIKYVYNNRSINNTKIIKEEIEFYYMEYKNIYLKIEKINDNKFLIILKGLLDVSTKILEIGDKIA